MTKIRENVIFWYNHAIARAECTIFLEREPYFHMCVCGIREIYYSESESAVAYTLTGFI